MDPRDRVKQYILDWFRGANASAGYVLPQRWVDLALYPRLDPLEKQEMNAAFGELIRDGLIDEGGALTEAGVREIY